MKKKNVIVFSVTFVLTLAVLSGVYFALNTSFLAQKPESDVDNTSSQVLGSSSLEDVSVPNNAKNTTFLLCGLDLSEELTDVIMVVNLDTGKNEVNVLQIPRDTYIGMERFNTGKINSVYGTKQSGTTPIGRLIKEINRDFKLPIDHYATVNIPGLKNIVDSMGGVTVNIPQDINFLPGQTLKKGMQTLNGEKAEWFVRYRKGYNNADIGRMHAQSLFLTACAEKALKMSKTQMLSFVTQNMNNITTDLTLAQVIGYYGSVSNMTIDNIHFYALEGSGVMYKGYAVYCLDKEKAADLLNEYFRPAGSEVPAKDLKIIEVKAEPAMSDNSSGKTVGESEKPATKGESTVSTSSKK